MSGITKYANNQMDTEDGERYKYPLSSTAKGNILAEQQTQQIQQLRERQFSALLKLPTFTSEPPSSCEVEEEDHDTSSITCCVATPPTYYVVRPFSPSTVPWVSDKRSSFDSCSSTARTSLATNNSFSDSDQEGPPLKTKKEEPLFIRRRVAPTDCGFRPVTAAPGRVRYRKGCEVLEPCDV